MEELDEALFFEDRKKWRLWLEKNHKLSKGIWIIHNKKSSGIDGLNHDDAVTEALCFGWVDSKLKRVDEHRYILRYTPRKSKSVWSKINKDKAEVLIASGKMTKTGFEKIKEAKQQGLWDSAYTNLIQEKLPTDMKEALMNDSQAWEHFQAFANSYRNNYIGWVNRAKNPETRLRRINEVVTKARKNLKPGEK